MDQRALKRALVAFMLAWACIFNLLLLAAAWHDRVARAIVCMALILLLVWVIGFGLVSWRMGDRLAAWLAERRCIDWRAYFVVLCTLSALLEEAVTTTLSNLAPQLGDPSRKAMITASRNYLEVVALHSVVIFVPMFMAWAWLLMRWDFAPFSVFLLFGVAGTLCESIAFGPQNLMSAGFWILVYGLMVYVPALTVPVRIHMQTPRAKHYALGLLLPLLCAMAAALLLLGMRAAIREMSR